MKLDNELKEIMNLVENNGYSIYLVGGAVRDHHLHVKSKDYDLTTNMPFDELQVMFPHLKVMRENDHRNTAVLRKKSNVYEFSMLRGKTIQEDLSKRDFKLNAIAVDVHGFIIDPFNGVEDINNKILSLVSDKSIDIDPLRILRALRISDKYNLTIDDYTKNEMHNKKILLSNVKKERILTELKMILISNNISYYINEFIDIFKYLIPCISEYNINTLCNIESILELRIASLFYTHIDEFNIFSKEYKLDNKLKRIVLDLIKYYDFELSMNNDKIYEFYKIYNMDRIELLIKFKETIYNKSYSNELIKYLAIRDTLNSITYDGNNLVKLGFNGKIIGAILDDVKLNIVCNRVDNDTKKIDEYVLDKYKKSST